MKYSLKQKQQLWTAAFLASCLMAAGVMIFRLSQPAGCRMRDLSPSLPVSAQPRQTDEPEKRVYLTFDDGPSATTETILDILKEKGVPATFFVIAAPNNEKYLPLIARETKEGHQIALHSCSHEYSEIYSSTPAFWADLKQLREKISPYVNTEELHWLRFPGGSTNTVSRKYGGAGIMKRLKVQAEEKGYRYVDWNVCANDAVGGRHSAEQILRDIQEDAKGKTSCVVLMHDTRATKTTAQALPDIIDWFAAEGYRFCRIEELPPETESRETDGP